jgi:hypothetical protein
MKTLLVHVLRWFNEAGALFLFHVLFLALGLFMRSGEAPWFLHGLLYSTSSPIVIAYTWSLLIFPTIALMLLLLKLRRLSHFVAHVGLAMAQFVAMLPLVQ